MHPFLLDTANSSFLHVLIPVIAIISVLFVIARAGKKLTSSNEKQRDENTLPTRVQPNDKLVIVNDKSYEDVANALRGFCKIYNEEQYQALPRLFNIEGKSFVITFPYDVDFDVYCFFINYLVYPLELKRQLDVTGWMTVSSSKELPPDKKIMLFVPEDDKEGDNVFATDENNVSYKIGFSRLKPKKLDGLPIKNYKRQPVRITDLEGKGYEDFK